ncbi:hypothetical protein PR002_g25820 [Phytophthora rubi]|uniref:Uncharacterized protein n=1 Tax=Phytophthora rubi TaxID=129364 RepID=A0A6A3I2Y8_9STRA|nr:hypothetical protein PR002_g25820 [Phytophthora rubi]
MRRAKLLRDATHLTALERPYEQDFFPLLQSLQHAQLRVQDKRKVRLHLESRISRVAAVLEILHAHAEREQSP